MKKILLLITLFWTVPSWANNCPGPVQAGPEYNPKFTSYKNLTLENQEVNQSLCVEENLLLRGQVKLKNNIDLMIYGRILGGGTFIHQKVNLYQKHSHEISKYFTTPGQVIQGYIRESTIDNLMIWINIFKRILVTFSYVLVMYWIFFHVISSIRKKKGLPYRNPPPKKQLVRELLVSFVASTIFLFIVYYFDNFIPYIPYSNTYYDWNEYPLWYVPVSFLLVIGAYDTTFYWGHRLLHQYNFLYKYMHFVHHASEEPNPFTSFSFNPFEIMFNYVIFLFVVLAIPMHFEILKAFFFFNMLFSVYHHCGYEILPKPINLFMYKLGLVTPEYHNVHHTKYRYHYSFVFTFWDKLCGTHYPDWHKNTIYLWEGLWSKKKK